MESPAPRLPSGRPPKRKRTEAELQALAHVLGADWTSGDTVQTWIHKHEGKTGDLSRMVEEGWLWEDIGKAMHLAGITYSSGLQIPAHTLRLKAYLSRKRERNRMAGQAPSQVPPYTPSPAPSAAGLMAAPAIEVPARLAASTRTRTTVDIPEQAEASAPEKPAFRLVTLKGGQQPPKPRSPPPTLPQDEPPAAKVSDDEILRRVFGKL